MLTDHPTHIHLIPPRQGVVMYRALRLQLDYANQLFNRGLAGKDITLQQMGSALWKETQQVLNDQFGSYSLEHISEPIFQHLQP